VSRKFSGHENSGGASFHPHRHWRRVDPRAAARNSRQQGVWSSFLPSSFPRRRRQSRYLQNTQNATSKSVSLLRSVSSSFGSASLSFFRWQIRCEVEAAVLGRGGVQALLEGLARSGKLAGDSVEGWAADRSGAVGAAVLGLLLEEEGGPIWVLWAPLCRVCSLTRRGRPLGRLRDERSLVRGRPAFVSRKKEASGRPCSLWNFYRGSERLPRVGRRKKYCF